ncbi:MAG: translation initiation factor IF-2 [Candidatus Thermochlorobacter sp.]
MSEEKKYKIADIAEELAVSAKDLLDFLRENNVKVASPSTKVTESVREMIFENFSDAKKLSDIHRKLKAEKERKKKALDTKAEPTLKTQKPKRLSSPSKEEHSDSDVAIAASAVASEAAATSLSAEPAPFVATTPVLQSTPSLEQPEVAELEAEAQDLVQDLEVTLPAPAPAMDTPAASSQSDDSLLSETHSHPPTDESSSVAEELEPALAPDATSPLASDEVSFDDMAAQTTPLSPPDEVAPTSAEEAKLELDPVEPVEEKTDLQREIERQQAEISSKFNTSENVGGLRVLGEIDLFKKKKKKEKKKRFGEQARDLTEQATTERHAAPPSPKVPQAQPQATEAKKAQPAVESPKQEFFTTEPETSSKKESVDDKVEGSKQSSKAKKKSKRHEIDEKTIERNIRETMLSELGEVSSRQKFRKQRKREREEKMELAAAQREAEDKIIKITEFATTHEFADLMGITPKEVIEKCFRMGKFITINQRLDRETMELLALEFGREIQFISDVEATQIQTEEDNPEDLAKRPPVVTIMGHVDHGKTSLLDYIRRSNVVAGEAGGITQHIGAYEVTLENGEKITFLDTPGHEAFTAMRARGVQVTDIVILVVAADDSVMPQTIEAINHAKAAGVPIVVAINKIDKPEANPDKIRAQLAENGVTVEEWGGDVQCQEISAKKGLGVRQLLDKVLAQADLMNLTANYNPNRLPKGVVIEAELDKGKGAVATILVQTGLLRVGAPFVAGIAYGRVRAMLDERGRRVEEAHPSQPVRVLGFEALPEAGDVFNVMPSDREAREVALRRQLIRREQMIRQTTRVKLNEISKQAQSGAIKELRIVLKADVGGSIEALADGLMKTSTNEVKVDIIHKGVGQITESDVLLAAASDAIIIGFRVRPNINAKRLAEKENIDIRFYSVIYHALEEIKDALEGMLSPTLSENTIGSAEVREVFRISKVGNVAGCHVIEGKIRRDTKVRLLRDGVQIYEGELSSLKRFKDDVKEVDSGFDCGLTLSGYDDIKVGDIIEAYETVETKRKLTAE